jgi:hypothetical protein
MAREGIGPQDRCHLGRETIEPIAHADRTARQVDPGA